MKPLKISNTKIIACPQILGVVLFLSMTPIMHSEITNFKYVISDHLGTAKMLIDEEGNVIWPIIGTVESNELLPFGGELDVFQSESRYNLNFTNKELDRVLDLHYFGARYYQANIGRFLSPDPIGGNPEEPLSWNKYLYCRNNPIMFIDPTGMAMTAPKPDDSNGFEFVGPPEPANEQVESALSEQIEQKIVDAQNAGVSADSLKPVNLVLNILNMFSKKIEVSVWSYGNNHSPEQWKNKMTQRNWTEKQITEAIKEGQSFEAENLVHPENTATRYVHPQTGKSVVQDNLTKEIIHVGGEGFKY